MHSKLRCHGCSSIVLVSIIVSISMLVSLEKGISSVSCWKLPSGTVVMFCRKA